MSRGETRRKPRKILTLKNLAMAINLMNNSPYIDNPLTITTSCRKISRMSSVMLTNLPPSQVRHQTNNIRCRICRVSHLAEISNPWCLGVVILSNWKPFRMNCRKIKRKVRKLSTLQIKLLVTSVAKRILQRWKIQKIIQTNRQTLTKCMKRHQSNQESFLAENKL